MLPVARHAINRLLRRTRLIDRIAELEASEQRLLAERSATIAAPRCRPEPASGPPIHLVTLPKSGSVYLWNVLSKGLGYECDSVSTGCFPRDVADWRKVRATAASGVIVQSHLDASRANLQILGHYLPRRCRFISATRGKRRSACCTTWPVSGRSTTAAT